MVFLFVALTFILAVAIDVFVVKRLAEKKADAIIQAHSAATKEVPELEEAQDILFHEGHTWVRVKRAVVEVGLDDFTQRFVGDISEIKVPEPGTRIKKGKNAWTIRFGDRELKQQMPISGMIFEVNSKVLKDPSLLTGSPYKEGWIVKILPDALSQELPDLYTPSRFLKWIDIQKASFLKDSSPELGLVYNDGETLTPGAANQIERDKWNEVARKIFGTENKNQS